MFSIRFVILISSVLFLCMYAWRDWFKSLCGLIVLAALLEHPSMPKTIMGIGGLNPWNVLCGCVLVAWITQRHGQGLRWEMPRAAGVLLGIYLLLILVGLIRAVLDRGMLYMGVGELVSEEFVNTLKWVLPGVMLFDGCRDRTRLKWALGSIAVAYVLLALQVVRAMPLRAAVDPAALEWSRLKIDKRIGLHAVDLSTMLAGGFWGVIAIGVALRGWFRKGVAGGAVVFCLIGQALTGGRAGYIAWAAAGLWMCVLRWRKALLLAPVAPLVLAVAFPAAADRMLMGFGVTAPGGQRSTNQEEVTSGRSEFWPYVIQQIGKAPLLGHGTQGTARSGLAQFMVTRIEVGAGWAHSAYLEWLMDHGAIGLVPVLLFFFLMIYYSARLFAKNADPWFRAAGGVALSAILVQGVAGIGSQHFYPRIGNMPMWCSIFLMLRVHVEAVKIDRVQSRMQRARKWQQMLAVNGGLTQQPQRPDTNNEPDRQLPAAMPAEASA